MPNNVDQRIVEMRFDNAQFENGVKQSTESLDKLKSSLDFSKVDKKGLLKLFDVTGSVAAIEKTAASMETFKMKAASAAKFAGKAMMTFGKASVGALTGITTALGGMALKGGITRAMNLKQANFMLKNLLSKEKDAAKATNDIMENVKASVDGTAYSMDQAALVAAQFAATGMRGGKDMQNALNGLAGAAATFNADYSRMGMIFTQVAATGKVYSNDLLQLSTMGMNARSTLVDFYKTVRGESDMTVKKLDDMVRKGEVDFNTFAEAMGWAFGDSATKANDTFQGALSNVKAALARIGEHVADPAIDALRDFFNTIRPLINMINAFATPSLDKFGEQIKKVGAYVSSFGLSGMVRLKDVFTFDKWNGSNSFAILKDYLKGVADGSIQASEKITEFAKNVDKKGKITENRVEKLVSKGKISFEIWKNALDKALGKDDMHDQSTLAIGLRGLVNIMAELSRIAGAVKDGFKDVFSVIPVDVIREAAIEFQKFSQTFKISDDTIANVQATFRGLFTLIKDFFAFIRIAGRLLAPFVNGLFAVASVALSVAARIADVVVAVSDFVANSTVFKAILKGLGYTFQFLMTIFTGFAGVVEDVISSFGGGMLEKRMSQLSKVTDFVSDSFKNLKATIVDNFPMFKGSIDKISKGFASFGDSIKKSFKDVDFSGFKDLFSLAGLTAIFKTFTGMIKEVRGSFLSISDMFGAATDSLKALQNVLETYQKNLDAAALITVAKAVAILAGSIIALSLVDPSKLLPSLVAIEILLFSLNKIMTSLSDMGGDANSLKATAKLYVLGGALRNVAIAVAILAGAVMAFSTLSLEQLAIGLFGMATACLVLVKVAENLTSMKGQIVKGAAGLIFFATAIRILADAVVVISTLSPEELLNGLGSVLILLGAIAMLANNMNKRGAKAISEAGMSFLMLGSAIFILAEACKVMGQLDIKELGKGLGSVLVMLFAMSKFTVTVSSSLKTKSVIAELLLLAGAMLIMAQTVKMLGKLPMDQIGHGMLALAGSLGILVAALGVMSTMPNTAKSALSISAICVALLGLAAVMKVLGGMKVEELKTALIGLAGGLAAIVMALGALSAGGVGVLGAAAALVAMSVAINALAPALKLLSTIPLVGIGAALLAVAGAITIFAVAAGVLAATGVIVPMMALAGVLTLIGIACAAAGVGVMAFASGIGALALVSAKSISNVVKIIEQFSTAIPAIFSAIGQGIVAMIEVLAVNAAKLAEVGVTLILALLNTINAHMQEFVTVALSIITNFMLGLAEGLPGLIDAGIQLMVAFINGMAEGIRASQGNILSAVGNLMSAIIEFVLTAFQSIANQIPVVGDDIVKGLEGAKKAVNEKLAPKEGQKSGEQYGKGISGGVEKSAGKTKKAGEKHAKEAAAGAKKPELMKAAAEGMGSAYNSAIGKAAINSKAAGDKLPKNVASGAGKIGDIGKAGGKAGEAYSKGVSGKSKEAGSAGSKIAGKAKSGMDSVTGYNGLGQNAAKGFVSGASSQGSQAYSAGWSLASRYYDAIKARLQEKSPSKETYKLAVWAVQGFINPSYDMANKVRDAGFAVAKNMLTGMKSQSFASDISEMIPDQMTIKPVVDLSGVKAAANDMNSIFTGASTITAASRIQVNRNRMSDRVDRLADAVSELNQRTSAQPAPQITNNIKVDGAENPEAFANRFVNQLKIQMRAY